MNTITETTADPRLIATMLAALRMWQRLGGCMGLPESDIATEGGSLEPMSSPEIDDLCERLNTGEVKLLTDQGPTVEVWVAITDGRFGVDLDLHPTEVGADEALNDVMRNHWSSSYGRMPNHWSEARDTLEAAGLFLSMEAKDVSMATMFAAMEVRRARDAAESEALRGSGARALAAHAGAAS